MYTYILEAVTIPHFAFGLIVLPRFFMSCGADFRQRKALCKCAKTGLLWLKWFPLDLPHSLQLSDFNQWQFSPHV